MTEIEKLLTQLSWTPLEIRTLNRYLYHPQNKKKCSVCFLVLTKNIKNFDIFRKRKNGEYLFTGRCKSCLPKHKASIKHRMKSNPRWYCNHLISSLRCRARKENINFNLSGEYLYKLWKKQEAKCYYTGELMNFMAFNKNRTSPHYTFPSIDKKVPSMGYIENNIVWCKWAVNRMKNNLTSEEFISFCKLVVNKHE